jgi:transposase-like protein
MTDAVMELRRWRWPPDGTPACPKCGATSHYPLPRRARFKCAGCHHQYSATSGTVFGYHKLTPEQIVTFLRLYRTSNPRQIAGEMGIDYHSAWRLVGKMRMPRGEDE